jgi:hypothetical protein
VALAGASRQTTDAFLTGTLAGEGGPPPATRLAREAVAVALAVEESATGGGRIALV